MKCYYAKVEGQRDEELQKVIDLYQFQVRQTGGEISLSKGFSTTPAMICLTLPDEVDPTSVISVLSFSEVVHAEGI